MTTTTKQRAVALVLALMIAALGAFVASATLAKEANALGLGQTGNFDNPI